MLINKSKIISDEKAIDFMIDIKNSIDNNSVKLQIEELYKYSYVKSIRIVKKDYKTLTNEEIEDSYQDAWLKVIVYKTSYIPRNKVFNWFYSILKHIIINFYKSSYKKSNSSFDEENGFLEENYDKVTSLIAKEKSISNHYLVIKENQNDLLAIKEIREIVSKLSSQESQAFYLIFENDLKIQDVASKMNIGLATVDTLKKSVISKIKYYLQQDEHKLERYT